MSCNCYDAIEHIDKSGLRERRRQATEAACGVCFKTESSSGMALKKCIACKNVMYCSRECQKADWKNHKPDCGPCTLLGIASVVKTCLASPLILHNLSVCAALEYGLDLAGSSRRQRHLSGQPVVVQVNLSFDPCRLRDLAKLCGPEDGFEGTVGVQAMVQFNTMTAPVRAGAAGLIGGATSSPNGHGGVRSIPNGVLIEWSSLRKTLSATGRADWPVAIMSFVHVAEHAHCTVPICPSAIQAARLLRQQRIHLGSPIPDGKARFIAAQLSHINQHIREDHGNELLMRRPLQKEDAQLILRAWSRPSTSEMNKSLYAYSAGMIHRRMEMEPVYAELESFCHRTSPSARL